MLLPRSRLFCFDIERRSCGRLIDWPPWNNKCLLLGRGRCYRILYDRVNTGGKQIKAKHEWAPQSAPMCRKKCLLYICISRINVVCSVRSRFTNINCLLTALSLSLGRRRMDIILLTHHQIICCCWYRPLCFLTHPCFWLNLTLSNTAIVIDRSIPLVN